MALAPQGLELATVQPGPMAASADSSNRFNTANMHRFEFSHYLAPQPGGSRYRKRCIPMKRACVFLSITILTIACLTALYGFGSRARSAEYERNYSIVCALYIRSNGQFKSMSQIYDPSFVGRWKRSVKAVLARTSELEPSSKQVPVQTAFTDLLLHQISCLDQIERDARLSKRKAINNHYLELYDTLTRDLSLTIREARKSGLQSASELDRVGFELTQFQV